MNLLEVDGVSVRFPLGRGQFVTAVDDVSFGVGAGEAVGLVGESGCGKSTLARVVNRLTPLSAGFVRLEGREIGGMGPAAFSRDTARQAVQMVFQDATDSLDPHLTAFEAIAGPIRALRAVGRSGVKAAVLEAAGLAGLPEGLLGRYPHQLSGGQKARVGIARAVGVRPRLLVLDEPTSALDVSVQAVVLRLFGALRAELGVALLFISHDLNVVRLVCDRVVVMYLGRVVETGAVRTVFAAPRHPYTRALVDAIPEPARRGRPVVLESEADAAGAGCGFAPRCPLVMARCRVERPALRDGVACHLAG